MALIPIPACSDGQVDSLLKSWKCSFCGYSSIYKTHLTRHLVVHDQSRPFVCKECGFATKRETYLLDHMKTHDINRPTPWKCDTCHYASHSKKNLSRHQVKHLKRPHKCELCSYESFTEDTLKRHVKDKHESKRFKRASASRVEEIVEENGEDELRNKDERKRRSKQQRQPRWKCDVCVFSTHRQRNLKRHQKIHQKNPYKCGICPFETNGDDKLKEHMSKKHGISSLMAWKCGSCDAAFGDIDGLIKHEESHEIDSDGDSDEGDVRMLPVDFEKLGDDDDDDDENESASKRKEAKEEEEERFDSSDLVFEDEMEDIKVFKMESLDLKDETKLQSSRDSESLTIHSEGRDSPEDSPEDSPDVLVEEIVEERLKLEVDEILNEDET